MENNNLSSAYIYVFNSSETFVEFSTDLPYPYSIVFIFLYTITAVLSVVGNVLVVIVLVVQKRLTKGVRYLLVNLAVADFFMAVLCIPFTCINHVYGQWLLSSAMCKIVMFVQDSMQVVSVLTLTVIGIERYFAILFPFKFHWLRSDRTIIIGLVIVWLVAICVCVMDLFYAQKVTFSFNGIEFNRCIFKFPSVNVESGYAMSNFLITYPIPIVILVFAYSSIAWKLFRRTCPGNATVERDLRQRNTMIKVIKMLVLIVVIFVLCWSPLQVLFIISWANNSELFAMDGLTLRILYISSNWVALSNCFANPFIYCLSNNEFWKDLKCIYYKLINSYKDKKRKLNYQWSDDSYFITMSQSSLQMF